MPLYSYEAADRDGRKLKDSIEAPDESALKTSMVRAGTRIERLRDWWYNER